MSDTRPIPWPWKGEQSPTALSDAPVLIRDLFGRKCRIIAFGDKTPLDILDIEHGRISIFLNENSRIQEIFIEKAAQER